MYQCTLIYFIIPLLQFKKCLSLFNTILQCPVPKISQIKLKLTCMYAFEEDFASTQIFCKPLVCNLNYNSEVEDYLSISA